MSRRKLLVAAVILLTVCALPFLGIQAYYGNNGLPESLFFRRTARHYCTKCGSQATSRMTTLFDRFHLSTTQPAVLQSPTPEGLGPATCEHFFIIIAASDGHLDFSTLR